MRVKTELGTQTVSFCLTKTSATKMAVAARAHRHCGQPGETAASCFDK
jgi:hypothetical protein